MHVLLMCECLGSQQIEFQTGKLEMGTEPKVCNSTSERSTINQSTGELLSVLGFRREHRSSASNKYSLGIDAATATS
ncbi:hypothetical protein CEXT_37961 [Caerostris extrusa]|uniref:Uncharacterized protein n=1 Tax=Caerostris extrusa TaxID=172846 RepID=A0AAV4TSH7_CAEEX|nr:hypothetical protein CEXT_37961 [Caerostris extrusa]